MLEVDVLAAAVPEARVVELAAVALATANISDGHLAVEFVSAERIAELNEVHRGKPGPTDVLSFPVDEAGDAFGPRELGDVVICPEHTVDLEEAIVHGVLHLVGRKVAIVSDKPQTTRRAIRGVATRDDWQAVLCDLPGVQRPRDVLTERMQRSVERELAECDGVLFVVDGIAGVGGPGDKWIAKALSGGKAPVTIAVNKADKLQQPALVEALEGAAWLDSSFELDAEIFPVAGRTGLGVEPLVERLAGLLPEGPFYFGAEEISDQREDVFLAELVREQVLRRTRQEVPHAVEVQVEEIEERDELLYVRAAVWVETESQKGILIGTGGRMIRDVGTAARKEIEREVGSRVHLELSVRVRRSWRADDGLLDRLGIT